MSASENPSRGEIVIYQAPDGGVELEVRLEKETIWLSQKQMSLLFDKDTDTIGFHLRNIYKEGELEESATTEESSVVQLEGQRQVRRNISFYNLGAIISVGYRVNSKRGTKFRIWATRVLRDHILQGYTVNESRLRERKLCGSWTDCGAIMQTACGHEVYPSLEEKAAHQGITSDG